MAKLFSYTWEFGMVLCKVAHYSETLSTLCSTLNLTALAVERLVYTIQIWGLGLFWQFVGRWDSLFRSSITFYKLICIKQNVHNIFSKTILHKKKRKAKSVQCHVCFVNVQVPLPHSNIYVKFCISRLCMKMSSFLFVRTWAMPRILHLSCGVPFPVWTPFWFNISCNVAVKVRGHHKKLQVIFL